jgi:protein TonB
MNPGFAPAPNTRFGWALGCSALFHAVALVGVPALVEAPRYGVHVAPNSVEVVLVEEAAPEISPPEEAVIAVEPDVPDVLPVTAEQDLPEPVAPQPTPVVSVPEQGAVQEAQPAYVQNAAPVYPRLARERGWQGLVALRVEVLADGSVGQVEVETSSGYGVLDRAALSAVRAWRFLPARLGHLALVSWVVVPVRFELVE